jgi:dTDP-4-amino-4,6-dideoxygalactose transaminase
MKNINLFEPSFGPEEVQAVSAVMLSNWTGRGSKVRELESEFAKFFSVESGHLTTTTCATEGVFAIFDIINLNENDEVIIPTNSFVGIATAIKYFQASIIFCDTDPNTLQAKPDDLLSKVTSKTKAVVLNHYGGYTSCTTNLINELNSKSVIVIEDAACAFGATLPNSPKQFLGTLGDFGVWSFDSMKLISMGDGGLIYSKNPETTEKIARRNYFGLSGEGVSGFASASTNRKTWWEFNVEYPGRRAILNDLVASIGIVQLSKFEILVQKRRTIVAKYIELLSDVDAIKGINCQGVDVCVSPYLFWIQVENRDDLANYLLENGVYTSFRYLPLHNQKFFESEVSNNDLFSGADWSHERTLNLPLHANLEITDVENICQLIRTFLQK